MRWKRDKIGHRREGKRKRRAGNNRKEGKIKRRAKSMQTQE